MKTLLKILLNAVLVLTAAAGALGIYLANATIVVPETALEKIAEKINENLGDFEVSIASAEFRLSEDLRVRGVKLRSRENGELVASVQFAGVHIDWRKFLFGDFSPFTIFADGLEIRCPAAISCSRENEILLADGRVVLSLAKRHKIGVLAAAHVGKSAVSVSGGISIPFQLIETLSRGNGEKSWKFEEIAPILREFSRSRELQNQLGLDDALDVLVTIFNAENEADDVLFNVGVNAQIRQLDESQFQQILAFVGEKISVPAEISQAKFSAKNLSFDGELSVKFNESRDAAFLQNERFFVFNCEQFSFATSDSFLQRWRGDFEGIELAFNPRLRESENFANDEIFSNDFEQVLERPLLAYCGKIQLKNFLVGDFQIDQLDLVLSRDRNARDLPIRERNYGIAVRARTLGSSIFAGTTFDQNPLKIRFATRLDTNQIREIPLVNHFIVPDISTLKFRDPVRVAGTLKLDENLNFANAEIRFDATQTEWQKIRAERVKFSAKIVPESVTIYNARVRGNVFCTTASIFSELGGNGMYRTHIDGTFRNVEALDPYLGWFWWRLWKDLKLDPNVPAPRANLDIYGSWAPMPVWERIYGAIVSPGGSRNGCAFDKARLRLVEDPEYIAVFELGVEKNGQSAAGTLLFECPTVPAPHTGPFKFDFAGTMNAWDILNLAGEGVPEVLRELQFETDAPATARAFGYFSGDEKFEPDQKMMVEAQIDSLDGDYKIMGVPARNFHGNVLFDGTKISLRDFGTDIDTGTLSGTVRLNFPDENYEIAGTRVEAALSLENVRHQLLISVGDKIFELLGAKEKEAELSGGNETHGNAEIAGKIHGNGDNLVADENRGNGDNLVAESKTSELAQNSTYVPSENSRASIEFFGEMTLPEIETLNGTGTLAISDDQLAKFELFGRASEILSKLKISIFSFDFNQVTGTYSVSDGIFSTSDLEIFSDNARVEVNLQADLRTFELAGDLVFRQLRGTNIPVLGHVVSAVSSVTTLVPMRISGNFFDFDIESAPLRSEKSIFNFGGNGGNGNSPRER